MAAEFVTEQRPIVSLVAYDDNPRNISHERLAALKRSLEADPDMLMARPLLALPDGRVIAGNQRLRAATELGWQTVPTITVDLDEQRAKLWALRDNNAYGHWDEDQLSFMLQELNASGADLDLAGFEPSYLDEMLKDVNGGATDPDEAPPVPAEPRSERGVVYELGPHRLMCGDATSAEDVAILMGPQRAVAIWTDPPYGVDYVGKTADALKIDGDTPTGLPDLLRGAFVNALDALEPSAPFYCAAPAGPRHQDFLTAISEAGWELHETLVWVKDVFVLGHSDYHYRHEPILYGYLPGPGRPGRGRHDGSRWRGDHAQSTVFEVARPTRSEQHPTMKPVELIEQHLRNSSLRDEIVYDPFAGSGSTMIAAENLNRRCYAMEIDPAYCDVTRQRYADYTNQPELAP